jgi:hypothetical protein
MNREQKIKDLVSSGVNNVIEIETHQWLGIIRSLLNIIFSSMDDKELNEVYEEVIGSDKPKAG